MSKSVVSAVILLGLLFGLGLLVGSRAAQKRQIIFEQPQLQGVSDNVHVPLAERRYPDDRPFNLIVWQPNSYRPDGELVPTVWRAGDMTGFYPPDPPARYQLAFRDLPGSSTVQIAGDTVGAYISSRDLPGGSPGEKMMITPAFKLPKTVILFPFLDRGTSIVNSLELQVPTAVDANRHGNFTYVSPTFFFRDRKSDTRISYGVTLFHHAARNLPPPREQLLRTEEVGSWDEPTHSFQVGNPIALGSRIVTVLKGSALFQTLPWIGWRPFSFAITHKNFEAALQSLKQSRTGFDGSEAPADYQLIEWHLNAEIKFSSGPADLGWSMRRALVALAPDQELESLRGVGAE